MSIELAPGLCPPAQRSADCSLDRLTEALEGVLRGEEPAEGPAVAALLRDYAASEETWRPYVHFREDTYSRNLVWRCGDFELLLLCWSEGQASPIHDHAGQQCWMAVLEGELEELHFAEPKGGALLQPGRVKAFPQGGVAYIHDDIAVHLIRPRPGTRAISLHLYSRPIDACRTFCGETGVPAEVHVGYHTVRGTDCGGADPALIREAWQGA